ncbi:type II toxin-antitoxin system VapC family toxin [Sphingomonas qilianensis]|uniref:Ribonuclease VapC n=1 Tax=Sphingomonas qilianensis TaxID=1736690 RepID=A0ABU9XN90_9SPHN
MILFLDASAMVAMMTDEPDGFDIAQRFGAADEVLYSAMSLWETVRAVARKRRVPISLAQTEAECFVKEFSLRVVTIGDAEARAAIGAHERYGKGMHRANLKMGDCFAYACAKTNNAQLLYKGTDFAQTDLA